ncbi:MAG: hypothetical protein J5892_02450 [Bacilli bacterium]|nr:hypothetical protein [Bacilli bacterium]
MNNLKEHINSIVLDYQEKTRSLSRDIKAINDGHADYQKRIKENRLKNAVLDDMFNTALIIAAVNAFIIIVLKYPGFITCLIGDTLIITSVPFFDFVARSIETFSLIKKDRLRVQSETELVKDVLDKYYKKIVELNDLGKKAEHVENTAELYNQVECIRETIIDDYVPKTVAPEIEEVKSLSLVNIFKKR